MSVWDRRLLSGRELRVCVCLHVLGHIYGWCLLVVYVFSICARGCLHSAPSACLCPSLSLLRLLVFLAAPVQRRCVFNTLGLTTNKAAHLCLFFLSVSLDNGWSIRLNQPENIKLFTRNCASGNDVHTHTHTHQIISWY